MAEGNKLMIENDIVAEHSLLKVLSHYLFTYPGFVDEKNKGRLNEPWTELTDIIFNKERRYILKHDFVLFIQAVYSVRDHWSKDTWRVLGV